MLERVARLVEGHVLRERHRQLVLGHRNDAAAGAVDDRNRAAPVALARHAPVAQAEVHLALADAHCLHARGDVGLGLGHAHAIEEFGVDENGVVAFLLKEGFGADFEGCGIGALRRDDGDHRQVILAREVEVALVMRWAAEDGAFTIAHQHEVRGIDREPHARAERVAGIEAQHVALLLGALDRLLRSAEGSDFAAEGSETLVLLGQATGQLMVS